MLDDGPAVAGSVIGARIGYVDLGFDLEMVLQLAETSGCDVECRSVTTFEARGSVDHSLFDLATADGCSSTHITAVGHAIDLDVTWSLSGHVEGHDIGFGFGVVAIFGSHFEVVFAKENVLEADALGSASGDKEAIAEVALLTKGHGVSMDGLSFWSGEIPSEFDWERVAIPFSSAWEGRNWVIHTLASVLKISLLGWSVNFLNGVKVRCDRESISGFLGSWSSASCSV